jgi:hypothetical protein
MTPAIMNWGFLLREHAGQIQQTSKANRGASCFSSRERRREKGRREKKTRKGKTRKGREKDEKRTRKGVILVITPIEE